MYPCSFPLSLGARRSATLLPHSQAAPLEIAFPWVTRLWWPCTQSCDCSRPEGPTDFAAVMSEQRWTVRRSAAQAALGEICTAIP